MDYASVWFVLIYVLFIGYIVLDGFDLGVGILHLFARNEEERRTGLTAIGPVWDGNEVWLITAGGALFAAFPPVYAVLTSGAYLAVVLFLLTLIFRGVSLEFRSKIEGVGWRHFWDNAFGLSSLLAALLLGVALGNIVQGFPIGMSGNIEGGLPMLLNLPALLFGIALVIWLTLHGAAYLMIKSEGPLFDRTASCIRPLGLAALLVFVFIAGMGWLQNWTVITSAVDRPGAWLAGLLTLISLGSIFFTGAKQLAGATFFISCLFIISSLSFLGSALYPILLLSRTSPEFSLTVLNGSSSPYTLKIMFIIACIGLPIVLIYTACIYRFFRGKVRLEESHY